MNNLLNHNQEPENGSTILHQAMDALKALVPMEYETELVRDQICDYLVRIKVFGKEMHLCAEVKKRLTKAGEILAMFQQNNMPYPLLLVTGYVTFEAATRFRDAGVQFIDTLGNVFINQPQLYIFVKGNKPLKEEIALPAPRLFKGVGLKIVYLLLCRPELVNRPYREIAEMADVAVGTVNDAVAEMARKGFLLDMGTKGKKLLDRQNLFERWAAAYPDYLKPKLLLGRFRGDGDWWKEANLDPAVVQWGGEVAAAKLTGYLKPGMATLYIDENHLTKFVIANRLKKDPHGNVEIFRRFWPVGEKLGEKDTVHPILVYADLAAVGEQRTMETAKLIYEQYLDKHFRED